MLRIFYHRLPFFVFNYFLFFIYVNFIIFSPRLFFWEKSICLHCAQCEWERFSTFSSSKFSSLSLSPFSFFLSTHCVAAGKFPQFLFPFFSPYFMITDLVKDWSSGRENSQCLYEFFTWNNIFFFRRGEKFHPQIISLDFQIFIFSREGESHDFVSLFHTYCQLFLKLSMRLAFHIKAFMKNQLIRVKDSH